ncbi:hypothetical protein C8J57DRAFT_1332655 [Mycena rebaudengoi]|nr:hypothetical protein C8J57DRAFT_1332655 [Mycena rebaudengoi]
MHMLLVVSKLLVPIDLDHGRRFVAVFVHVDPAALSYDDPNLPFGLLIGSTCDCTGGSVKDPGGSARAWLGYGSAYAVLGVAAVYQSLAAPCTSRAYKSCRFPSISSASSPCLPLLWWCRWCRVWCSCRLRQRERRERAGSAHPVAWAYEGPGRGAPSGPWASAVCRWGLRCMDLRCCCARAAALRRRRRPGLLYTDSAPPLSLILPPQTGNACIFSIARSRAVLSEAAGLPTLTEGKGRTRQRAGGEWQASERERRKGTR